MTMRYEAAAIMHAVRLVLLAMTSAVVLGGAASAKEIEGVRFADEFRAGSVAMRLNDVGLMRDHDVIRAYVAALYLVLAGALVGATIRVRFWRVPFATIPASPAERVQWLYRQWQCIDEWIAHVHPLSR